MDPGSRHLVGGFYLLTNEVLEHISILHNEGVWETVCYDVLPSSDSLGSSSGKLGEVLEKIKVTQACMTPTHTHTHTQ